MCEHAGGVPGRQVKGVSADKRVLVKGAAGSKQAGSVLNGRARKSPCRQESVRAGECASRKGSMP